MWTGISGGLQSRGAPVLSTASNSRLVVFDENKTESASPSEPRLEPWGAPPPTRAKENTQRTEKWCDVKVKPDACPVQSAFCLVMGLVYTFLLLVRNRCHRGPNSDTLWWRHHRPNPHSNHLLMSQTNNQRCECCIWIHVGYIPMCCSKFCPTSPSDMCFLSGRHVRSTRQWTQFCQHASPAERKLLWRGFRSTSSNRGREELRSRACTVKSCCSAAPLNSALRNCRLSDILKRWLSKMLLQSDGST